MGESTVHTYFCRKPRSLDDLREESRCGPVRVQVEKVIDLTPQQYRYFCSHLLRDMPFIIANKALTGYDNGLNRCLLVTTRNIRGGILVDCQGFNYARYSAEVRDKSALDLRDVPVKRCGLKPCQRRNRQEQR